MRKVVFINASPKVNEPSASQYLIDMAASQIDEAVAGQQFIHLRQSMARRKIQENFAALSQADALIIAFPLYIFCLPGMLMRFLEDYLHYYREQGMGKSPTRVYAIVNCGFPEPDINLEAVRVIKSFCRHVNADFRFGILIGGGGMLLGARQAPFMKKTMRTLQDALALLAKDMESGSLHDMDNIHIAMPVPRRFYLFMGNRGWFSLARQNGLKKKALYRRPYQNA